MIKYNSTIFNAKKYLTQFSYSKCKSCKKISFPLEKFCCSCRSKNEIIKIKSAVLIAFTENKTKRNDMFESKNPLFGLVKINDELEIFAELVTTETKYEPGQKLIPVLRRLFKDPITGYIQYYIKFQN